MKKTILGTGLGFGMLLLVAVPAMATDSCWNEKTGPYSTNKCRTSRVKKSPVVVNNTGYVNQDIESESNTGGNTSNYNTVGTNVVNSVDSGNAVVKGEKAVLLNAADVRVSQADSTDCFNCGLDGYNGVTGPYSNNEVTVEDVKELSVNVNNNGNVTQKIRSRAISGGNQANYNTIAGGVKTGSATVDEKVLVDLNYTFVKVTQ